MNCGCCGTEITEERIRELTKSQRCHYKATGRWYCSQDCMKKFVTKQSSERMKILNQTHPAILKHKKDMITNNPMHMTGAKEKMIKTLNQIIKEKKENGIEWFKEKGGNGKEKPMPQQKMFIALEKLNPIMEYVVPTKIKRGNGYPTCYKIDIGLPDYMIAIEIDGKSHNLIERQKQDQKKQELLEKFGWKVLRFKNQQVMEDLEECVKMVMSIISK